MCSSLLIQYKTIKPQNTYSWLQYVKTAVVRLDQNVDDNIQILDILSIQNMFINIPGIRINISCEDCIV